MANIYLPHTLINEDYLKAYSPLPKNYDITDIKPFIPIAEYVHIVDIVSKPLYDELIDEVATNTVTDVNSTLLLKIYPLEAMCIVYEALPFIYSHLTEKGITLGKSDNAESISSQDLSNMTNHILSQIEILKRQLKEFLDDNASCYPLYQVDNCTCEIKNDLKYLYPSNKKKINRNY